MCARDSKAALGGDNHLAVVLEPYKPNVRCEGSSSVPFSRDSCSMIERGMEADDSERLFGDKHLDPAVEEPLPFELLSSEPSPPSYPAIPMFLIWMLTSRFFSGRQVCGPHLEFR